MSMKIRIHRLLSKISYLRSERMTLSEFATLSGIPRSTLSKLSSGKDVNISVRTLERIISTGFFEIRRILTDRDRLSDAKLREQVVSELLGRGDPILFTKRQVNEASRVAIEEFSSLRMPDEEA